MKVSVVSEDRMREEYFRKVSRDKVIAFLSTSNLRSSTRNEKEVAKEYAEVMGLDSWFEVEKMAPTINKFFKIKFDNEEEGLDFIESLDTEYPDYCCLYIDGEFRYENT